MMNDDLYSGLDVPKKTKREREEEIKSRKESNETLNEEGTAKRRRKQHQPLDVSATITKLEGYMLVDKKFAKASALFCQLMLDRMTVESSEMFMKSLTKVIDEKGDVLSGKKEFQSLIETLDIKREVILSVEDAERNDRSQKLDMWKFLALTHAQLFTDDTYQFNKAAKVIKRRFDEIVSSKESQGVDKTMQRLHAEMMPVLRTLYNNRNKWWATTIVDSVLAVSTHHRLLFNEQDRVEIDKWTKVVQDRRNAPAIARSAGSEARRNIVATSVSKVSEAGAKIPVIASQTKSSVTMLALHCGLTRAALNIQATQLRTFASGNRNRLTWRQKAKIAERKRNPQPPRQQPRHRAHRQNFLVSPPVDDGKKWRVLSAGVLERLPIIQPDLKDWEVDFEVMLHEKSLREDQRLDEDFWFMEPGTKHITPEEAPWPNAEESSDELVGDGFHLAPRETEDDANNNRKSLNRALKGRVFLLVKSVQQDAKYPWFFPFGAKQDVEKMRDAAVRHVNDTVGNDLEVTPVGFGPVGYIKYLHENDPEFDGTKVFFYKSQHLTGDVILNLNKANDYVWVTRNELSEYLDPEIAEYIHKMVPP
ncbi:putative 39S ribosomal protein L46 [Plasmopara halstedii]